MYASTLCVFVYITPIPNFQIHRAWVRLLYRVVHPLANLSWVDCRSLVYRAIAL